MTLAVWTGEARADLARFDDYHSLRDADFAWRLGQALLAAARFLADHPRIGSPLPLGTRKWRVTGFDFFLIYRETTGGVEILRAHHGRQNWRVEP
jgi:toxin ParE1/3/4